MIRIGIVGYGYWGPKLARNFADSDAWDIVAVADGREACRAKAKARYPAIDC